MGMLKAQPWFIDGLDELETALLKVIGLSISDDYRKALIQTHYIRSVPVKLPLTGGVELIVVRHTPFSPDNETLVAMEEGVKAIEDFTKRPFPVKDLILLVVEPDIWGTSPGSTVGGFNHHTGYDERHILVNNRKSFAGTDTYKGVIYHEIGHLYQPRTPRWLSEGGAQFLRSYTRHSIGEESIEQRLAYLQSHEQSPEGLAGGGCSKKNIQEHLDNYGPNYCDYYLGEVFLLAMYVTIGEEAVSAALGDLQTQILSYRSSAPGELIYQAFEKHTPPGKEDAFKAAYRLYHGGQVTTLPPASPNRKSSLIALYNRTQGASWRNNQH